MAVRFLIRNALILALIGLAAFFATQSEAFVTVGNFKNILINGSILSIIVVTSTMLLIAGHLDLSVGSTVGLGAIMAGYSLLEWGWSPAAAIALGIVAGSAVGVINGSLCAVLGFSPIIVTLGMLAAVRATTLLITESAVFGLGEPFNTLGSGELLSIPILVLFAGGAFILGWLFLALTPWGRHTYAIGVNPQAAFLSGLSVRALPFWLYVATGTSAGLAGVLFASRLDGAAPADMGAGLEIDALTAVLLGGVAFAGGRGNLGMVLVAVLFLGVLQNGLLLMNVTPFIQLLIQGLALVVAAGLDVIGTRLGARTERRRQVDERISPGQALNEPNAAAAPGGSTKE
jgi:ribose/xylose/arabinose/galactoside ABC-type transport system permease subunit